MDLFGDLAEHFRRMASKMRTLSSDAKDGVVKNIDNIDSPPMIKEGTFLDFSEGEGEPIDVFSERGKNLLAYQTEMNKIIEGKGMDNV